MANTRISDYHMISCGCCTGREIKVTEPWGAYTMRTDQCVCWQHQDAPRGLPAIKCSHHGTREPRNAFTA